MLLPKELWCIIKDYLLFNKFKAIQTVKYNASLPYMLGFHNYKGIDNNINYLWEREKWIFDVLHMKQVKKIINKTEKELCD